MKKGFTMVELAIVMLAIGLILAMAMKGRDLVASAKEKAIIQSMVKLEAASNFIMLGQNGKVKNLPTLGSGDLDSAAINDMLLKTNMLVEKDLLVPGHEDQYWSYRAINFIPGAYTWATTCSTNGDMLCPGMGLAAYATTLSPYWACRIESRLDEMHHANGIVRSNVTGIDSREITCKDSFPAGTSGNSILHYQIF
jgi:prepilin-type N-terminal cleavage/methylation domain-containing protein